MNLREYAQEPRKLASLVPWDTLVTPGVVQLKDGHLLQTIQLRGPDLDSSLESALIVQAAKLNALFKHFTSGWALWSEARRREVRSYPEAQWPDPVSARVDAERRAFFTAPRQHYDTEAYLTLVCKKPPARTQRVQGWLWAHMPARTKTDAGLLERFTDECTRTLQSLQACCQEASVLEGEQLLAYLKSTVSTKQHRVLVPEPAHYLDTYLTDQDFHGGIYPMLGPQDQPDAHLRCLGIKARGYPEATYPGIWDVLTTLPMELRAVVRYLPLDRDAADQQLNTARKSHYGQRKRGSAVLAERFSRKETALMEVAALDYAAEAAEAQAEVRKGRVSMGYLTSTVVVWDADLETVTHKTEAVEQALSSAGFSSKVETLNAVDAWRGTIPGNLYANVRRPLLHSLNLAHLFPSSSVYRGPQWNTHLSGPPVLMARGKGHTPIRVCLHEDDVGHTGLIGSTGDGKSTFLNFLCLQQRRYPEQEIVIFDKMHAARKLTAAVGGLWYDLGHAPLQPLARLHEAYEIPWAVDWLEALLTQERVSVTPDIKDDLYVALVELATWDIRKRTMTSLTGLIQHPMAKVALKMYTKDGPYGMVTDGEDDGIGNNPWLCFELNTILDTPRLLGAILPALFHRLEQRLTGVPTLYVMHEAWIAFDTAYWAERLRGWLKGFRVRNGSVVLASQSLADAVDSPIMPALLDNVATWIFTPNNKARTKQIGEYYEAVGLNERQRELLELATKKQDYYIVQNGGQSMIQLDLGPMALAFCGTPDPAEVREIEAMIEQDSTNFAENYLRARGICG